MIPQYEPQYNRQEIAKRVNEYILGNNFFSENNLTKQFESAIANYLNVKYAITVTNGTMAIALALLANGIKAGDRVLIPNITMMSTQSAVELIGAKPILIDVDIRTACMDLKKIKEYFMVGKAQAVIYVTLNGRSASIEDKKDFLKFCQLNNIKFIEDNAQAFGSKHNDGSFISCLEDNIGCFSMSFHKLLSSGQGGFCVTNNAELAIKLRRLKNVGRIEGGADIHEHFGINNKFTDIQSILGLVGLEDIDDKRMSKQVIYGTYRDMLFSVKDVAFIYTDLKNTVPWFIDIYTTDRAGLIIYLKSQNIGTRNIYPELTSQKINEGFLKPKHLKTSIKFSSTGLWLPSSLNLTYENIKFVCDKIKEYYGN